MNYQNAANQLAVQGRGGDTTLVHMSPREVKGLQALAMAHGGSLSINPSTGLPEAGFLSSVLPMIGGAALTAMGVPPPLAAAIMGGGTALATGDMNRGLMAGLGAYGGAGIAGGLMGAGAGTAEAAANALGVSGAATGAGSQAAMLAAQNQGFGQAGLEALGQSAGYASGAAPVIASPFQSMGQGLSSLVDSGAAGQAARSGFMSEVGGLGGLAKYGLAAAAPMMGGDSAQAPQVSRSAPLMRLNYEARPISPMPSPDPGGRQQRYFEERYVNTGRPFIPGDFATATPMPGMANGGPVDVPNMADTNTYDSANNGFGQASANGYLAMGSGFPFAASSDPANPFATQPMMPTSYMAYGGMAHGGASHLGDYSDGGRMLRGPGDGVSDSIPATIGGKQPARLADGEFVVPARIVSELGNGSSEAGARRLYAMMDRIQNARKKSVGKGKVAVDTKAEKMLPA